MRRIFVLVAAVAVLVIAATPVGAADGPRPFGPDRKTAPETDAVPPVLVDPGPTINAVGDEFDGDPLRLVVWPNDVRRYSQGIDQVGVYICTWDGASAGLDVNAVTATLNNTVAPFYHGLSDGLYNPVFVKRTVVTLRAPGYQSCADAVAVEAADHPFWDDNAAIAALDNSLNGGRGGPGVYCGNCAVLNPDVAGFPANQRWAVVDGASVASLGGYPTHVTTAAHEIGHTISFPHSYSGESIDEYDNPIDYMSGNMPGHLLRRLALGGKDKNGAQIGHQGPGDQPGPEAADRRGHPLIQRIQVDFIQGHGPGAKGNQARPAPNPVQPSGHVSRIAYTATE